MVVETDLVSTLFSRLIELRQEDRRAVFDRPVVAASTQRSRNRLQHSAKIVDSQSVAVIWHHIIMEEFRCVR